MVFYTEDEINPKHPSLNTHEYKSLTRQFGIKIFEAYDENSPISTSLTIEYFGTIGPDQSEVTIIAITPNP
jgi:hypothetical protein